MDEIRLEIMMKEQEAVVNLYRDSKLESPDMDLEDIKVIVGEKITARIAEYEQLIFTMKTRQQLLFSHKSEIMHSLDIVRAEKLRQKDKLYKPLTPDAAGEARERLTEREKQIKGIQKVFDCGRDEAEAFLLNPAKIPGKIIKEETSPIPPIATCLSCGEVLQIKEAEKGICTKCDIPKASKCEKCGVEISSGVCCEDCLIFT